MKELFEKLQRIMDELHETAEAVKDQSSFIIQSAEEIYDAIEEQKERHAEQELAEVEKKLAEYDYNNFAGSQLITKEALEELTDVERKLFLLAFIAVRSTKPGEIASTLLKFTTRPDGTVPTAIRKFADFHGA